MLSAIKRYRARLSEALARYFPRTTAYLRAEREATEQLHRPKATRKKTTAPGKAKPRKVASPASGTARSRSAGADSGIYRSARMKVSQAQVTAMRERVAQAVVAGVVSSPSDEQWAMILGRAPLTRIFAGAGSGKSTTLVLRVVFMLCHMGIPAERLTVISFTNASCAQLREQLQKVLAFWQFPFDTAQARQCVRTFHSAMGTLAKALLGNPRWFEQLDDAGSAEPDNPLLGGRLRPAQQRLLQQAYQACYAAEPKFRERVHRLLDLSPLPAPADGRRARADKAPQGSFSLAGEFVALPLHEAFYAQAGFIESIGIRLDRLNPAELTCSPRERLFAEALVQFWQYFVAQLDQQGLMTFNAAFQRLGEVLAKGDGIPVEALAPFSHLLIDEFQDISPQIVQWLQAVHRALTRQGQAVSLMAIGDDWQSIYGWRGSSPELFMDFDRHFPSKGKTGKSAVLMLETNYRSIEPVLRDAEKVLQGIAFKQAKTSKAFKVMQPGDHGVKLVSRFDLKSRLPELVKEVQAQCRHVASRPGADRNAVLLLSRRNEPLAQIKRLLDPKLPVRAYSIHRAKGLQAEVAIIVDDCAPPPQHPLRNALYAHCGFFRNSYDQAMQDESLRLAYVAITRGVSRVIWYTGRVQGATWLLG